MWCRVRVSGLHVYYIHMIILDLWEEFCYNWMANECNSNVWNKKKWLLAFVHLAIVLNEYIFYYFLHIFFSFVYAYIYFAYWTFLFAFNSKFKQISRIKMLLLCTTLHFNIIQKLLLHSNWDGNFSFGLVSYMYGVEKRWRMISFNRITFWWFYTSVIGLSWIAIVVADCTDVEFK